MERSLENSQIPAEWESAVEVAAGVRGAVIVLGAPGSGKSTFSFYLVRKLHRKVGKLALVDCDLGQSHLGPPSTLSMTLIAKGDGELGQLKPDFMRFVGSVSPSGFLLQTVVNTKKLVDKAYEKGANIAIIDTSGMVYGGAARELKFHQIELICPKVIVALQQNSEIEHILTPLEKQGISTIVRMKTPPGAKLFSREQRRSLRRERFASYFKGSNLIEIDIRNLSIYGSYLGAGEAIEEVDRQYYSAGLGIEIVYGERTSSEIFFITKGVPQQVDLSLFGNQQLIKKVRIENLEEHMDRLIGICDAEKNCLALGRIKKFDSRRHLLALATPLQRELLGLIKVIQFGSLRVNDSGDELWPRPVIYEFSAAET